MPSNGTALEDEGTDGWRDSYKLMPVDVRLFAVSKQLESRVRGGVLS